MKKENKKKFLKNKKIGEGKVQSMRENKNHLYFSMIENYLKLWYSSPYSKGDKK